MYMKLFSYKFSMRLATRVFAFKSQIKCTYSTFVKNDTQISNSKCTTEKFETVYSLPLIKYISMLNRLKVYQLVGSSLIIPACGLLEMLSLCPENTLLFAAYVGITGSITTSLASLPFLNTIGFLYISEDNKKLKISSVDFWGRRKDRIVPVEDWIPLLDMPPTILDAFYLSPKLTDGTKYKFFIKFGNVTNSTKIGQVLE